MAVETSQGTWLQVPAYDVSDTLPSDLASCYRSCVEHYRACRRAHTGARLLGTISFYQVKRFKLFASEAESNSSYEVWAHNFKSLPENSELQTADMEWLARAGGIISFVMRLDNLPDQGHRADYMVQEVGSIKQLKTLFPKIFNKNTTWNDGDRLQDVFPHEFRKIKDALKAPGTLAKLYKDKRASKAAKAATVSEAGEVIYPSAAQAKAGTAQATSAAGAAASKVDLVVQHSSDGSTLRESPAVTFAPAAPAPAAPAPAPAATATTEAIAASDTVALGSRPTDTADVMPASTPVGVTAAAHGIAAHSSLLLQQLTAAAATWSFDESSAAAAAAIAAAGVAAGAPGAAEPAVPTLQTASSGVGNTLLAQAEQQLQRHVQHPDLGPRKTPPSGPVTEQLRSPAELPARPQSPFQEFLHVLIECNSGSSADEHMLPASLQQQEQQSQQHVQEHEEDTEEHDQQQQEQQDGGGGETVVEATGVSGHVLPVAEDAIKRTAREVQPKRASCALASADKPGPSKKAKQDSANAADVGGAAVAEGGAGGSSGPLPAGPSSMEADSSTMSQEIVMQQQRLRRLQQRGVMGVTLVQWLEQHAARMTLQLQHTAPTMELQGDILDQVYVVEKWCDDISPLLRLEHSRAFMVLVLPEQQLVQNHADDSDTESSDEGVQQKQHAMSAQQADTPSEWKGTAADWMVPRQLLSACRALKTLHGAEGDRIVASHEGSNLLLRHNDLACLRTATWLNDECVNFYMALLQDRDRIMYDNSQLFRGGTGAYHTYFFSSHFMSKLKLGSDGYSYNEVRKWTSGRKQQVTMESTGNGQGVPTEVLKYDRLVIPIHQQMPYQHWTVLLVDLQQRRMVFFDSYKKDNPIGPMAIERVKLWLADEAQDKLGEVWQTADWAEEYPTDLPQQDNDYDCGVFALMACNRLGLKSGVFDFGQDYMVNLRAAIAHDLQAAKVVASANPACVN